MSEFTPISNEEYLQRIKNVQNVMDHLDLDIVVVYGTSGNYENLRYLTGYWPMFERGGVCIPRKGQAKLLIGAEAPGLAKETPLRSNYCLMSEYAHTFEITWRGVAFTSFKELFDLVTDGKGAKRVGLTNYTITPVDHYQKIKNALLPGGEIISISHEMEDLRMHKSEAEIELIKQANLINQDIFEEFLGQVKPEMTEYEAQGLIIAGMYKHGGEAESFPTLLYSGARTLNQIGRGTHNKIGINSLVDCDFGTMLGTYSSAFCRPFIFGKMPAQMKKDIEFLVEVHKKLPDWIKPGVKMEDVQAKYIQEFLDHGYGYPPAGCSHGIGIFECEPPLMSRGGIIDENMTFAADHFFKGDGYGFRLEDCYVVKHDGAQYFTEKFLYPIEL